MAFFSEIKKQQASNQSAAAEPKKTGSSGTTSKIGSASSAVAGVSQSSLSIKNLKQRVQPTVNAPTTTTRGILASIQQMGGSNPSRAQEAMSMFEQLRADPTSVYYNPYAKATNRATDYLRELGFNMDNVNDDWYNSNRWLMQYYVPTANTNGLSTSMTNKRASPEQKAAYYYNQLYLAEETTKKAESEWQDAMKEIDYWVKSGLNLSDEQIIQKLNISGNSKYKILAKMDEGRKSGTPMELNRAIGYGGEDYLYGAIWAARNGSTGNEYQDMVNSAMGVGNVWKEDPDIQAKLDVTNPATFAPYSVGMVGLDEAGQHFGRSFFDQKWVDDNRWMLQDGTEEDKKNYINVAKAVGNADAAEKAATALKEKVDALLASGNDAMSEEFLLSQLDTLLDQSEFSILDKMDESIARGYDFVAMSRKVDYRKQDIVDYIHKACTEAGKKQSAIDMAGEIYGPEKPATAPAQAVNPADAAITNPVGTSAAVASPSAQATPDIQKLIAEASALAGISTPGPQNITPEVLGKMSAAYDEVNGAGSFDALMSAAMEKSGANKITMTQGETTAPTTAGLNAPATAGTAGLGKAPTLTDATKSVAGKAGPGVTLLTQADIDEMKQKDRNAAEAALALDGKTSDTEAAYLTYSSQGSQPVEDYLKGSSAEELAGTNTRSICKSYSDEMISLVSANNDVVKAKAAMETAQKELPGIQKQIEEIEHRFIATGEELDKLNGMKDFGVPDYVFTAAQEADTPEKHDALLYVYRYVSDDFYVERATEEEALAKAAVWSEYLMGREKIDREVAHSEDEQLQRLKSIESQYQKTIMENQGIIDSNADAAKKYEEKNLWMDETIKAYEAAGIDTTDLKAARVVSDFLGSMNGYQYVRWGSEGYYQGLADSGKSGEEIRKDHEKFQAELDDAQWLMEYVKNNDIQVPDKAMAGMESYLRDLEENEKDYQYYSKQFEEGFSDKAKQGREIEKETYNILSDGLTVGGTKRDYLARGSWNIAGGLDSAYYSQFMTPKEKDTFYSLYTDGGKENGRELAWEYYKHLAYDTHILQYRDKDKIEELAAAEVGSGFWGGAWSNFKAILSAPIEGIAGAAYSLEAALGVTMDKDFRINPADPKLRTGTYSAKVYEETENAIHKAFEKQPVWDKVFTALYETGYNQGRSAMNAAVFGGMTAGISNQVLQEIVGASNMAAGAMAMTIADATERGASREQALLLGGITYIAESFSEGLTYSNIHDMVTGIRAGSPASVKEAIVEWLTQSGFEEAAGEVANSAIENWADRTILGSDSEHAERVNNWYEKLKQENPSETDVLLKQKAEEAAERDELMGYVHTAFVSYLGPGLNVGIGLAKSSAERVMDYHRVSNVMQNAGINMSISEVREMYKARDNQLNKPQVDNVQIANVANTPVEVGAAGGDSFVKDASVLNAVAGKSAAVGTAAVSSILYNGPDKQATATAKAAAVGLNKTLGGNGNAIDTIKTLLAGAKTAGVSGDSVKAAIQVAALAPHSKTALFLNSDAFKGATAAQKAQILSQLGQLDARNGSVLVEMNSSVKDGIRADFMAAILADGAGKPAVEAKGAIDAARKQTKRAERVLEEKRDDLQKATDAVKAAEAEVQRDPGNGSQIMEEALNKLHTADIVERQQAESVEAQKENEEQTKKAEEQKIDETLTEVRTQADQAYEQMQEEQRQLDEQKQKEEEQRLAEEQQKQAEEDAATGKTSEDQDTDAIDSFLDAYGYEGEERETEREKMLALREKVKYSKFVSQNLNTPDGFMAVASFSRKLGMTIKLEKLGDPKVIRGKYENGVIYLNENRVRAGDYTVGQALVEAALHEITHSMETTQSYGAYRDAVLGSLFNIEESGTVDSLYESSKEYRAAIDQKIADYNKVGKELTKQAAEKEIIADFARTRLNDKDVVNRLIDRGLGWKMRSTLHNINDAMKNFYGQLKGEDRTQAEYLRRAERSFQKMMSEAAKQEVHPEGGQFSIAQIAQATGMTFDEKTLTLYDSNGNAIDGVNYRITPDMIGNTPVGLLIANGLSDKSPGKDENGNDKPSPQKAAMEMMAGLMNMVARYKDSDLVWEIGASTLSSTFSALKSNSDPQYATTVDFGTVCAKTQAIIDVMSQVMLDRVKEGKSGGLTREEIMKVYDATHNAGLSVPCPVCYVFSRWMGVPSLLGQMSQYQNDYVVKNDDGSINKAKTQEKVDAYIKNAEEKYGDAKAINNRKAQLQSQLASLDQQREAFERKLYDKNLTAEEKEDVRKQRDEVLQKMVEIDNKIGEVSAYNWITQALCKKEKASGKYVVDPKFKLTPDEILFDLNRTGEFAEFEKNWKYRNTRGAGMGKAIMPYSGETIGDILYGVKASGRQIKNPWLNMDPKAAARQLANARTRAKKQNLVGGQRLQSTSDFRPEWGLDYIMSFLELQAAGSKVQMYTKVAEAVDFFASVGADVNISIMGEGQGWHVDENGNYVLDFSSITGMNYETAKALKNKYNNVQMILVGMNDTHIRLAMANSDIDFIIPWHSSGNSKEVLSKLISTVGEKLDSSVDYTTTQTDMVKGSKKKYKNEKGETVEYSAPGVQTEGQKALWDARVKLLTKGGDALTLEERNTLLANPFTADLYRRFTEKGVDSDCYGVKLNKSQATQIFPYEYWDTNSTKETADVNGKRFVEYCEAMGIVPRFSQFKDDPGYWKLLIDRPMYNNDGSYHQQQTIDVTGARIGALNESGNLIDSDLPTKAQAKYAPKDPRSEHYEEYNQKERNATEMAKTLLEKPYDDGTGEQLSVFGDQTEADRALLSEAAEDYRGAVERGDMDAAAQDVESYAAAKGYTLEAFHGTSEYFNVFNRGEEGIHLGNEEQAKQVAYTRYETRSKMSSYEWNDIKDSVPDMNVEQRESLVKSAWFSQDYFDDGKSVEPFSGDINDADAVFNYANDIYSRYEAATHSPAGVYMRTFDRKTGENIMHLYARINNPFVINGDIGQWTPMDIARVLLERNAGVNEIKGRGWDEEAEDYKTINISGSDLALDETQRDKLEQIRKFRIRSREEQWDIISDVLDKAGYDGIQYLNTYEGDRNSYSYIALNQSDVKSADTVTYDDQGNMIPLEERFTDNPDIRYSSGGEETEADKALSNDVQRTNDLINMGVLTQQEVDEHNALSIPGEGGKQRQFGYRTSQGSDALHDEVKSYLFNNSRYTPESNQEQIDRAIDWVQSRANENDPDGYRAAVDAVTSEDFDYRSADGQARMLTVMSMAALMGDLDTELRLADAYNRQGTDLGRALQARKIFRLMTPIGRKSYFLKQVDKLNAEIGRKTGKTGTIEIDRWLLEAAGAAETEEDFTKVRDAVARQVGEQIPANWKDKLRSWRMLAMLGNPRTHIRNIIGNAMFIPAVSLKNKLGAVAELGLAKGNKTKTLALAVPKEIRDFARQDAIAMKNELTGEAKYNEEDLISQRRQQFRGLFQILSDFNSNALEGEDWFFLKGHYRRALGGWIHANGYTVEQVQNDPALLEQARTYAIHEAQKATYRDFNGLAKRLNDLTRNPETTGQKLLAFGVEAVLPFKKTPANILKRGLEYSPVGIARALTTDLVHLKQYRDYQNGKLDTLPATAITPNQFIDNLCSGLTGTAIMALGAWLGSMGVVSCGLDDKDDEFEKLQGNQEYSIKFSIGGNDYTFTMDWAAPMCMPFFVGAAIQEQVANEQGLEYDINKLVNAFGNITEPVFNLSMLDGVNSLLDMFVAGDDTNATITQLGAKMAANYVSSYIPAIVGATARTIDDTRRKSFVESGKGSGITGTFRYAYEQLQNKIPGWSQTNIPYRDVWGNAEKSGLTERILENFVLPGYINQYKNDPIVNELQALGKVPKEPGKTISANGEKYILTDKQWDAYKTERGQTAYNMLGELFNRPEYQNAGPDDKAALVDGVWSYADKIGKEAAIPELKDESAAPDADPLQAIIDARAAKITDKRVSENKKNMITELDSGNMEGFNTMLQALRDDGVSDDSIKDKIGNTYRDKYKDAYRNNDVSEMLRIKEMLNGTGFNFNTDNWEKAVRKEQPVTRSMPTESVQGTSPASYLEHLMELDQDGGLDDVSMAEFFNTINDMTGERPWDLLSDAVADYVDYVDPDLQTAVSQMLDYLYDNGYTENDIYKRLPNRLAPLHSRPKKVVNEGRGVELGERYVSPEEQAMQNSLDYMAGIGSGAIPNVPQNNLGPDPDVPTTFNGDLSSVESYDSSWLPYYPYGSHTPQWDEDAPEEAKQGL